MRSRLVLVGLVLVGLVLAGCVSPSPADAPGLVAEAVASVTFDAVTIETRLGSFKAILFCDETPKTCEFFRTLVEVGYYDGRAFGRVLPGFVIQEVDRTGGTTDQSETVGAEFGTDVMFSAGAFGIARNSDPDSGSSEFFIMDFATSRLYGNYTAYAQVIEGLDVVHAIAREPAVRTGPASSLPVPVAPPISFGVHDRVPVDPVVMTSVAWTSADLPAAMAARYPLRVGETFTSDALRATLEWPADLAPGRASDLAWYAYPRDPSATSSVKDPPPLDLSGATIRFDGAATGTLPFAEDPTAPGALGFEWTPPVAGSYQLHLEQDGEVLAVANVTLPQ